MNRVYENCLLPIAYGHPLYHARPDLQPGHVGCFDSAGEWHLMKDLTIPLSKVLPCLDIREAQMLHPVSGSTMEMREHKARLSGHSPAASAEVEFEWESTKDESALLITDPVRYKGYSSDGHFREWIDRFGSGAIQKEKFESQVQENGLYLITGVYCTKRCSMVVQLGKKKVVRVSFTADAIEESKVTGKGKWTTVSHSGLSHTFSSDESNDSEFTIFCGGIHYSSTYFFSPWPLPIWPSYPKTFPAYALRARSTKTKVPKRKTIRLRKKDIIAKISMPKSLQLENG